ncbi:fibronectin type III -containing domain protein [Escherichia coli P0304777.7]|nr:fibronectin type III -containing domain protein [Escherichia coli P0304777.7]
MQHVPEKEAIVDNGAHFDGDQSGTVMVSRRQRAALTAKSRRQRGISGAGAWDTRRW